MAGINGFGANNFGNYGNNVNKAGQKAQNLKQQGVAGNQAESLTFKKTESTDGFKKTETENDVQYAKKKDKGEKTEKKDKKGFGAKFKEALEESLKMLGGHETQNIRYNQADCEGAVFGDYMYALWIILTEK